jgi:ribosomal protein S27E
MDVIFNCPTCEQELAVDAAAAGSEIQCPTCNTTLVIPTADRAKAVTDSQAVPAPSEAAEATIAEATVASAGEHTGAMASSAAGKIHMHFKVPQHDKPADSLIQKPNKPLEVAAKDTEKKIRTKTIRHTDCIEVGKDRYDEIVSDFLQKVGRDNIINISPINYTYMDLGTRQLMTEYGISVIYIG